MDPARIIAVINLSRAGESAQQNDHAGVVTYYLFFHVPMEVSLQSSKGIARKSIS